MASGDILNDAALAFGAFIMALVTSGSVATSIIRRLSSVTDTA